MRSDADVDRRIRSCHRQHSAREHTLHDEARLRCSNIRRADRAVKTEPGERGRAAAQDRAAERRGFLLINSLTAFIFFPAWIMYRVDAGDLSAAVPDPA